MEKVFRINLKFGIHTEVSFNAVESDPDGATMAFSRIDALNTPTDLGVIWIDENKGTIRLAYDIFFVSTDICSKKEVDGNLLYICQNDLFSKIKICIADYDEWLEKGDAIFQS